MGKVVLGLEQVGSQIVLRFGAPTVLCVQILTCGSALLGISLRTTVLPAAIGCGAALAATWPLPLPPPGTT